MYEMTLRDYFAAKALQGMVARKGRMYDEAARHAFNYANAMLHERKKRKALKKRG